MRSYMSSLKATLACVFRRKKLWAVAFSSACFSSFLASQPWSSIELCCQEQNEGQPIFGFHQRLRKLFPAKMSLRQFETTALNADISWTCEAVKKRATASRVTDTARCARKRLCDPKPCDQTFLPIHVLLNNRTAYQVYLDLHRHPRGLSFAVTIR